MTGDERAQAEDDAVDVDAHDAAVRIVGDVVDVALVGHDARVQARDVERLDRAGEALPLGRVADVGRSGAPVDRARDALRSHLVDVDHDQVGAVRGEPLGDGVADAGAAAGDERSFTERARPCPRGGARRSARCARPTSSSGNSAPTSGCKRAGSPRAQQLADRLLTTSRPVAHQPAEVEADESDVAARRGGPAVDRLPPPPAKPIAISVPSGSSTAQDSARRRRRRPGRDDVGPHGVRNLVVDVGLVGAESSATRALLLRARPSRPRARPGASRPGSPPSRRRPAAA